MAKKHNFWKNIMEIKNINLVYKYQFCAIFKKIPTVGGTGTGNPIFRCPESAEKWN